MGMRRAGRRLAAARCRRLNKDTDERTTFDAILGHDRAAITLPRLYMMTRLLHDALQRNAPFRRQMMTFRRPTTIFTFA